MARKTWEQKQQEFKEIIIPYFESYGYSLLSKEYENVNAYLHYICPDGHKGTTTWETFKKGHRCNECKRRTKNNKKQSQFEVIKQEFEAIGYQLVTQKEDYNGKTLEFICRNGHKHITTYGNFSRGVRCGQCYKDLQKKYREDNPIF